jgi:hypothetical protein
MGQVETLAQIQIPVDTLNGVFFLPPVVVRFRMSLAYYFN